MAGFDRGMRRLVGSFIIARLFFVCREHPHLVDRFLRSRIVLQLSALHGDDLSRVPHPGGLQQIPDLYRPHHAVGGADRGFVACLAARSALDFYDLPVGKPLAL